MTPFAHDRAGGAAHPVVPPAPGPVPGAIPPDPGTVRGKDGPPPASSRAPSRRAGREGITAGPGIPQSGSASTSPAAAGRCAVGARDGEPEPRMRTPGDGSPADPAEGTRSSAVPSAAGRRRGGKLRPAVPPGSGRLTVVGGLDQFRIRRAPAPLPVVDESRGDKWWCDGEDCGEDRGYPHVHTYGPNHTRPVDIGSGEETTPERARLVAEARRG